jgi:hypothetical protein
MTQDEIRKEFERLLREQEEKERKEPDVRALFIQALQEQQRPQRQTVPTTQPAGGSVRTPAADEDERRRQLFLSALEKRDAAEREPTEEESRLPELLIGKTGLKALELAKDAGGGVLRGAKDVGGAALRMALSERAIGKTGQQTLDLLGKIARVSQEGLISGAQSVFSPVPPGGVVTGSPAQKVQQAHAEFERTQGRKPTLLESSDISAQANPLPIGVRPLAQIAGDPMTYAFLGTGPAIRGARLALGIPTTTKAALKPFRVKPVQPEAIPAARVAAGEARQVVPAVQDAIPLQGLNPFRIKPTTTRGALEPFRSGLTGAGRGAGFAGFSRPPTPVVPVQRERTATGPATSRVVERISFEESKEPLRERLRGGTQRLIERVFDDLQPIKRFVDAAKRGGARLSTEENPYLWSRLLKGVAGKSNAFVEDGTFGKQFWRVENGQAVPNFRGPGLQQILKPVKEGKSFEDFSTYLVDRRAVELANKGIETGIARTDAVRSIAELNRAYPEFDRIAQQVYKYQDDLLQYGAESGLFSPEMLGRLREYRNYVPFHRVMEGLETRGFLGTKLANIASPIKRIRGSERPIISPLESIIKNTHAIIDASDRNQVGVMMARLVNDIPELRPLFRPISTPTTKVATATAKDLGIKIEGMSPEDADLLVDIFRPVTYAKNANEVTVLVNGQKRFFEVDPDLYRGLLSLERQDLGAFGRFFGAPARWLRAGAILAPDFMVKNPQRDQMTAFVYSRYGFIPGIDAVKGAAQMVGRSDTYQMFRMSGAEQANLVSMDRNILGRTVAQVAKEHGFTDYIKNPIEMLRVASEFGENATRLGEFRRAIARGEDPFTAGFTVREVTQDFAKMGTITRAINQIIPFFGANVGGWSRLATEYKTRPIQASMKAVMGITIPSLLLYSLNRNDPRYAETPQWQKDLFWIIPNDGLRIRIPKPFMLGQIFGSMPERFFEWLDTRDPDLFGEAFNSAVEQGTPGFLPQAMLPFIENMANHSFFLDRPVIPRDREDAPAQLQYAGQTSEAAKALGKWANLSPAQIDNLFMGYTGTLGRYVTDAIDPILKRTGITPNIPDPAREAADTPVLKAFVLRDPRGSGSESVNKFYRKLQEFEGMEKVYKELLAMGEQEAANKHKDSNPEAALFYDYQRGTHYSSTARALRRAARQMSDLRRQQREAYNSRTMTPEQKRRTVNELGDLIAGVARQALTLLPQP